MLPNSEWLNPGVLYQHEVKDDGLTIRYGGRLDYVQANPGDYNDEDPFLDPQFIAPPVPTQRNFDLVSGFATIEYDLDEVWTAMSSVGHGQRAPSNYELFADGLLMAGYQHGFASFTGNPRLDEERITQVDFQMVGEFANARFLAPATTPTWKTS